MDTGRMNGWGVVGTRDDGHHVLDLFELPRYGAALWDGHKIWEINFEMIIKMDYRDKGFGMELSLVSQRGGGGEKDKRRRASGR